MFRGPFPRINENSSYRCIFFNFSLKKQKQTNQTDLIKRVLSQNRDWEICRLLARLKKTYSYPQIMYTHKSVLTIKPWIVKKKIKYILYKYIMIPYIYINSKITD